MAVIVHEDTDRGITGKEFLLLASRAYACARDGYDHTYMPPPLTGVRGVYVFILITACHEHPLNPCWGRGASMPTVQEL